MINMHWKRFSRVRKGTLRSLGQKPEVAKTKSLWNRS